MIAPLSSPSAAPLRPITVMPVGCQCLECAPQLVMKAPAAPVAPAAPSISSPSNVSPSLNLVAAEAGRDSTDGTTAETPPEATEAKPAEDEDKLSDEEKAQLAKLRARDREVRAHEQAHAAAGAGLAGAPSYSFQQGPDGKQYAVGGEVSVRANASSGNPRQAIAQLQQVARAALAPASPSGQDRAVAAQARAQAAQLQAQLAKESQAKAQEALKSGSEKAETGLTEPAPAEAKPLLPELPRFANKPAGGTGESDAEPRRAAGPSALPPIAASVIAPPNSSDGAAKAAGPIAAYRQASIQATAGADGGRDPSGSNPPAPRLSGRIISLNA